MHRPWNFTVHTRLWALFCLLATVTAAWAGRPLATDDASTVEPGSCYVESWVEWAGSQRSFVLAPACAVAQGIEIAAAYALPHPRDDERAAAGLSFKWVPESWKFDSAAGPLGFGFKLGSAWRQPAGAGWQQSANGALFIATLVPADAWALHANLGVTRDRSSSTTAGLLNLALVWTPREDALFFAEAQTSNRRSDLGGTVSTAGGRWWALKDILGVDLTASQEAGGHNGTRWSFGFGWYGLGL